MFNKKEIQELRGCINNLSSDIKEIDEQLEYEVRHMELLKTSISNFESKIMDELNNSDKSIMLKFEEIIKNKDVEQLSDKINERIDNFCRQITEEFLKTLKHIDDVKTSNQNFKDETSKRIDILHQEIAVKYINAVEKLIQSSKEISLIDILIKQTDSKDLVNLKRSIMQPILEERIKEDNKKKGQEIEKEIQTKGELLLLEKKTLHEQYLKLQREGKDTKYIEGQLNILNKMIGEGTNAM